MNLRKTSPVWTLAIVAGALAVMPSSSMAADPQPNGGWDATWSPDGSQIAFTSGSPHSIPNLWIVGANGTGLRQMTTLGAHEPRWLPDGKTVVFGTVRTGQAVYMAVDPNGQPGSEKPLDVLPAGAENPVWTADGSLVAYGRVSKSGTARDIWFARATGGSPTGVTARFWCREWAWAPSGGEIAFVVGRATGTSIWTVNVATQDMQLLYKGYCSAISYSPDGKRLAFAAPDARSGFHPVVVDLTTRKQTSIDVRSFNGVKLMWSPDGSRLYFSSSRKAEPAIWSVGSDGAGLKRVSAEGTPTLFPALSPDGSRFACQAVTKRTYGQEIQVVDTAGKVLASLTPRTSPSFWAPVWSPSGTEFACQSDVNHQPELFVGSASGRLSKPYAPIRGADAADVLWLPGGNSLLLADAGRLAIVDKPAKTYTLKPLPKLTAMVEGVRLHGDEVVMTQWGTRNALLAAHKMDGTGSRLLTQRQPIAMPGPPLAHPAPSAPAASPAPAHAHITQSSYTGDAVITLASETTPEPGNPHANLGVVGPQEDTAAAEPPAVIDLWPAVSPNGKTVAFTRDDQTWLVGIDGTGERKITSLVEAADTQRTISGAVWAPDGKSMVFTAITSAPSGVALEIWRCGTEPGSEHRVYTEPVISELGIYYSGCTYGPAFTPDGKRVVFTSIAGSAPRVMSLPLDGGDATELAPAPSCYPALDSSGARLAYVDLSGGHERIRIRDLKNGSLSGPLFRK